MEMILFKSSCRLISRWNRSIVWPVRAYVSSCDFERKF